jgi:hypothetical protein
MDRGAIEEVCVNRSKTIAAVLVLLLIGCSGSERGGAARQGDQMHASESTGADEFSRRLAGVLLPPEVQFDFPFVLVSERLYTRGDNGETRRGLMLEFSQGTTNSLATSVVDGFRRAGYTLESSPRGDGEGRIEFTLTKKGAASVYVDIRSASQRAVVRAESKGTIWLSWRVRGAS